MTVFNESLNLVQSQVQRIKEVFPYSDVVICYDGVDSFPISDVIHHRFDIRLKTSASAGLWMENWLKSYVLYSKFGYMLKIDPDTEILGPITHWPRGEVVFGSTKRTSFGKGHSLFRIHGGGCGYSRPMVTRLLKEKWLQSPEFVNNPRFLDQEDVMLAHLIEKHNLNCFDHPEFSCGRPKTSMSAIAHR